MAANEPSGQSAQLEMLAMSTTDPIATPGRFFVADFQARNAELDVEVIYPDIQTDNVFLSARLKADKPWKLSPNVMLQPERGGSEFGWRKVAIRFTAHGANADFHIDDLVVDPRRRS